MRENISSVFNRYNINIMFTTHHLPCRLVENKFDPQVMKVYAARKIASENLMTDEIWAGMTVE